MVSRGTFIAYQKKQEMCRFLPASPMIDEKIE
jgi:hypothetical protein